MCGRPQIRERKAREAEEAQRVKKEAEAEVKRVKEEADYEKFKAEFDAIFDQTFVKVDNGKINVDTKWAGGKWPLAQQLVDKMELNGLQIEGTSLGRFQQGRLNKYLKKRFGPFTAGVDWLENKGKGSPEWRCFALK